MAFTLWHLFSALMCEFCGMAWVLWRELYGSSFVFMFYGVHFVCSVGFVLFVLTLEGLVYGLSSRGFLCTPKLLDRHNYKSKGENKGRIMSWGMLFGLQHFEGKRAC